MILHDITPEELYSTIRKIVQEEMTKRFDKPITKADVCDILGVSMATVDRMLKRGDLKSITPKGQHPKFLQSEILKLSK